MGSDYEKMEKSIRFLEDNSEGQPTLEETARQVNLSPYHFQRLFKKWVGGCEPQALLAIPHR